MYWKPHVTIQETTWKSMRHHMGQNIEATLLVIVNCKMVLINIYNDYITNIVILKCSRDDYDYVNSVHTYLHAHAHIMMLTLYKSQKLLEVEGYRVRTITRNKVRMQPRSKVHSEVNGK